MQIKTFTLPISSENGEIEDFNKFLRTVRILELKKELVKIDCGIFWAVCVTYIPGQNLIAQGLPQYGKGKVDYKEILSEEYFERFCRLRKIRKSMAEEAAIPAYAVFTDAELAEMSKIDKLTISALKSIKGIGEKKIEKYGIAICQCMNNEELNNDEADG